MAKHRWSICTTEAQLVEVQHAVHSSRLSIKVDGKTVFKQDRVGGPLWDTGFRHEFTIDGTRWLMTIRGAGDTTEYDLREI